MRAAGAAAARFGRDRECNDLRETAVRAWTAKAHYWKMAKRRDRGKADYLPDGSIVYDEGTGT